MGELLAAVWECPKPVAGPGRRPGPRRRARPDRRGRHRGLHDRGDLRVLRGPARRDPGRHLRHRAAATDPAGGGRALPHRRHLRRRAGGRDRSGHAPPCPPADAGRDGRPLRGRRCVRGAPGALATAKACARRAPGATRPRRPRRADRVVGHVLHLGRGARGRRRRSSRSATRPGCPDLGVPTGGPDRGLARRGRPNWRASRRVGSASSITAVGEEWPCDCARLLSCQWSLS